MLSGNVSLSLFLLLLPLFPFALLADLRQLLVKCREPGLGTLVHGWHRIKHVHFYYVLGLSTHKNVKCYPTMTKTGV